MSFFPLLLRENVAFFTMQVKSLWGEISTEQKRGRAERVDHVRAEHWRAAAGVQRISKRVAVLVEEVKGGCLQWTLSIDAQLVVVDEPLECVCVMFCVKLVPVIRRAHLMSVFVIFFFNFESSEILNWFSWDVYTFNIYIFTFLVVIVADDVLGAVWQWAVSQQRGSTNDS